MYRPQKTRGARSVNSKQTGQAHLWYQISQCTLDCPSGGASGWNVVVVVANCLDVAMPGPVRGCVVYGRMRLRRFSSAAAAAKTAEVVVVLVVVVVVAVIVVVVVVVVVVVAVVVEVVV
ncbi:hypothetical protein ElyMa_000458800 [Elysia marginata]|uniref:Uncharacterized protein n=1 Tax=Elysia marginata TaxID=1093978 RepID=A0AAV4FSD7_9GAST|nr:hypothetical protein ElyMa_000458800 [Elysia marginata]